MNLEFVTRAPKKSAQKNAGLFSATLKVNTKTAHLGFSKKVVLDIVGEDVEFKVGIAFDKEARKAFLFTNEEGLKASATHSLTSTYLSEKLVENFGLEESQGKVLHFDVNTTQPIKHEESGILLYELTFTDVSAAKTRNKKEAVEVASPTPGAAPEASAPAPQKNVGFPVKEEESPFVADVPAAAGAVVQATNETTVAEQEGDQAAPISEVAPTPPSLPLKGMEWPSSDQ